MALASVCVAIAGGAAHAQDFAYRFSKDTVLRYKLKKSQNLSYKGNAGKVLESEASEQTLDFHPVLTGGTGGELRVRYRDLKSQKTSPELSFKFDWKKT